MAGGRKCPACDGRVGPLSEKTLRKRTQTIAGPVCMECSEKQWVRCEECSALIPKFDVPEGIDASVFHFPDCSENPEEDDEEE